MSLGLPTLLDSGIITSGTSVATANVSGSTGDLFVVVLASGNPQPSPSVVGTGLTFNQQSHVEQGDTFVAQTQWRCQLTAGFTGTLTISFGGTITQGFYAILKYTGQKLGGTNGSNAFVQTITDETQSAASPYVKPYGTFSGPTNGCLAIGWTGGGAYTANPRTGWTTIYQPQIGGVCAMLIAAKASSDTQAEENWLSGTPSFFSFTSFEIADNVAVTPTKLGIQSAPTSENSNVNFTVQPVIKVQDAGGNTVVADTSTVVATLNIITGDGILQGTTSKTAVAGIATFTNLNIYGSGTFTITFTDGALTSITTPTITVGVIVKIPVVSS